MDEYIKKFDELTSTIRGHRLTDAQIKYLLEEVEILRLTIQACRKEKI